MDLRLRFLLLRSNLRTPWLQLQKSHFRKFTKNFEKQCCKAIFWQTAKITELWHFHRLKTAHPTFNNFSEFVNAASGRYNQSVKFFQQFFLPKFAKKQREEPLSPIKSYIGQLMLISPDTDSQLTICRPLRWWKLRNISFSISCRIFLPKTPPKTIDKKSNEPFSNASSIRKHR